MPKRCRFQALITLRSPGAQAMLPDGQARRMTLRGRHSRTGRVTFFSAIVTGNGQGRLRWDDGNILATITLTGEDAPEYFGPGSSFTLWLDGDVGQGIVTRRLFWPAIA